MAAKAHPAKTQRGAALIVAILAVALLTGVVMEIQYAATLDITYAIRFRERAQAYQHAEAGLDAAMLLLQYDSEEDKRNNAMADYYFNFEGLELGSGLQIAETWSLLRPQSSGALDVLGLPSTMLPLDGGAVEISIEDLNSRINLNRFRIQKGMTPAHRDAKLFTQFLEKLGIDEDTAIRVTAGIIDWIDEDGNPVQGGAESDEYRNLLPPYMPRNGPMMTPDELRAVAGVDDDVYDKVKPYITVFPHNNKLNAEYKINVNTATPEVLTFLNERLDLEAANQIVSEREGSPFMKILDVQTVFTTVLSMPEVWGQIQRDQLLRVTSDTFYVKSTGYAGDTVVRLEAVFLRTGGTSANTAMIFKREL